jgi:DNA replication protein DnaC
LAATRRQCEDIDYHAQRGLDRALFLKLSTCDWIRQHRNLLVSGPTGIGKSWISCALGHKACRENLSVLYQRVPRLMAALALGASGAPPRSPDEPAANCVT